MASLLLLDVAGAFDNVLHERLLHNLKVKGIPTRIVQWTASFLRDRATSITLGRRTSPIEPARTGIPQGLLVFPILFLFFNISLIKGYKRLGLLVYTGGFVDNIHLLAYSKSIERNCQILEKTYRKYARQVAIYSVTFASTKYNLVHLTRKQKKVNFIATVRLEIVSIQLDLVIRVLGL